MIQKEDYEEPRCPLCMTNVTRIPVGRVIEKLDEYLADKNMAQAERHLLYWLEEAKQGHDEQGEITILNELIGFYRKEGQKENSLKYAEMGLARVREYGFEDTVSGATTYLNSATAYKAFGFPEESAALYNKTEKIYLEQLDAKDSRIAGLYNNYALALTELGSYMEAMDKYDKALLINEDNQNGRLESAITWLNKADLLSQSLGMERAEEEVYDCLDKAYELLTDERNEFDPYYEFVFSKCIPSFDYYGQFLRSEELKGRIA